jgi:hypothetical protein
MKRVRKSEMELVNIFWAAPNEAFFGQETIAPVTNASAKTLEANRWKGVGIPYRKTSGRRILYRKSDVITWLEGHQLVNSTSKYKCEVNHV